MSEKKLLKKNNTSRVHGPHMMGTGEKSKDFKGTMKKLINYMKPYKIPIILTFIFSVSSAFFNIIGPKIMSEATDLIFNSVKNNYGVEFERIARFCFVLLFIYLISTLSGILQGSIMADVAQKISYNLRENISKKINKVPLKYYDNNESGDVLSRITNDVDTISNTLNQGLSQMISSITAVIGITIIMLTISVYMTVVALLVIPMSMFAVKFIIGKSQKYFSMQQKIIGDINGLVEEVYGGHFLVKVFNGEESAREEFLFNNKELYKVGVYAQFFGGVMMPVMNLIGNIGYVFVAIIGGYLASVGMITIGAILAFVQYIKNFTQPIQQVANIANILQSTVAAAERVFEFLEEEEEVKEVDSKVNIEAICGNVKFKNVSFGYSKDTTEDYVINNLSIEIKAGQKVAIVGPTGAGKTTIVKLLMRFYELNKGDIFIDGVNVTDITRKNLRQMFGMVLQDTWLFQGSIMDNLRFGNLEATDEEVYDGANSAYAHKFIKKLPNGYNMEINEEGTNISVGQKQLLTIARAIIANPKILILDEATSSVDTRTEILIQKGMENLMKGRTSFVIAHRLSTIKDSDVILVMDRGDIVEVGNHYELLKKKGFYFNLYNSQFEEA